MNKRIKINPKLKLFYQFLHDNNALMAWEQNFIKQRTELDNLTRAMYFEQRFNTEAGTNLIIAAFTWGTTPQGYDYWHELHGKWRYWFT